MRENNPFSDSACKAAGKTQIRDVAVDGDGKVEVISTPGMHKYSNSENPHQNSRRQMVDMKQVRR